jgi:hypothetical protein
MIPTKELLQHLNGYRILEGKQPLDSWKRSRSDLETLLKTYYEEPEAAEPNLPPASDPQYADDDVSEQLPNLVPSTDEPDTGAEKPAEMPAAPEMDRPKSPRGAIGVMVMDLLQTEMPYKDIVKTVRDTYWDAKTTERSVASIAMDLRRDGVNVPARRKPAAIKQVVAAAQAAQSSTEVPKEPADQA